MERLYASETEESAAPGKPGAAPTEAADAAAEESAAAEAPAQAGPAFSKVGWLHSSSRGTKTPMHDVACGSLRAGSRRLQRQHLVQGCQHLLGTPPT